MKKLILFLFGLLILFCIVCVSGYIYYTSNIKAVGGNKEISFEVVSGDTYNTLYTKLKKEGLIKSELAYKIYIKLNKLDSLKIGVYELNTSMDLETLLKELSTSTSYNPNVVSITFKEGINIRGVAKEIESVLGISSDEVINVINDKEYIKELINKYWFLEEDILNTKIYYPLEGYLFPSTYEVYKDSTVKDVVEKMLNQTDKILTKYKTGIEKSGYSVHEILTLASIVELESGFGTTSDSDKYSVTDLVASVFHNRVKGNWSLGSDVTTYYYLKIDDFKVSLNGNKNLYTCDNAYNTRCTSFTGLPVGPISLSGEEAIASSINIVPSDYYYFVADCKGKVYFTKDKTGKEHRNVINKLKAEGNWCS